MWHDTVRILMPAIVGALLLGSGPPAHAVEIKDDAGFFSQKALDTANARLADLKKETGKEVRIETFKTVPGGKADEVAKMDRAERAKFFEKWARERATAEHAKGIFILICRQPGHVQIEDDKQTREQGFGNTERAELRDKILAGFRDKEYDKGLVDGVDFVVREVKKLKPKAQATGTAAGAHRGDQRATGYGAHDAGHPAPRSAGTHWLVWVVVAVVILLGIRLIAALFSGFGGGPGGGSGPGGYGYGGGGGGGFFGSLMTGMFGAFAGNWLYHQFFDTPAYGGPSGAFGAEPHGPDQDNTAGAEHWEGSGGDFGDDGGSDGGDSGGGDFGDGGGGDFGGGDSGGDLGGGGDFGGGDSGGDGGGDF
jgi:hypothetical protein